MHNSSMLYISRGSDHMGQLWTKKSRVPRKIFFGMQPDFDPTRRNIKKRNSLNYIQESVTAVPVNLGRWFLVCNHQPECEKKKLTHKVLFP